METTGYRCKTFLKVPVPEVCKRKSDPVMLRPPMLPRPPTTLCSAPAHLSPWTPVTLSARQTSSPALPPTPQTGSQCTWAWLTVSAALFPLPGASFYRVFFFLQNRPPWLIYLKPHPVTLSPLTVTFFSKHLSLLRIRFVHFPSSPLQYKLQEGFCSPVLPGPKTGPHINRSAN